MNSCSRAKRLRPAAIFDTNGAIVTAALAEHGGEASFLGAFDDEEAALDKIIREALRIATWW